MLADERATLHFRVKLCRRGQNAQEGKDRHTLLLKGKLVCQAALNKFHTFYRRSVDGFPENQ